MPQLKTAFGKLIALFGIRHNSRLKQLVEAPLFFWVLYPGHAFPDCWL